MLAMQMGSTSSSSKRGCDQSVAPSALVTTIRRLRLVSLRTLSSTRPSASSTAQVSLGKIHSGVSGTAISPRSQVRPPSSLVITLVTLGRCACPPVPGDSHTGTSSRPFCN